MSIDSSLARGIAARTYAEAMALSTGLFNLLAHDHLKRQSMPTTQKGARKILKNAVRYIRVISIWQLVAETNHDGPYCGWIYFEPADKERNIALSLARYAPIAPYDRLIVKRLAVFSKHSIARGHQRLNHLSWDEVRNEFRVTILMLWLTYEAKKVIPLQQVFLPTPSGICVGDFNSDGLARITTFMSSENLSSRWSNVWELISRFSERPEHVQLADSLITGNHQGLIGVKDWFLGELRKPEFAWLQDPYSKRYDPVGVMWDAAKVQARTKD